ncbi:SDR family NAD(P)-dependent oxidoreductase [Amycolatopsis eburnea]|uniref:SDR family oxidoreductase n=1 Tax=Amycolatopsis eburnea TaxID=2267691 RepID=A0A427T6I0_9PSEU|nr:SDR family oxidoreductase [Amycolatopsis eburnea]RSD14793.1 SDR family oxidoreductase [Amycolatopsis eburnea]
MSTPLKGKVALITGGSNGIGRAIAERLARDGATVAITYARDGAAAKDTVAGIEGDGGQAFALQLELGRPDDATRLWAAFDDAGQSHVPDGKLDILIHNAAAGSFATLAELTEENYDKVFAVNVRAPFFITQAALPRLRDGGRVINISSLAATLATPETIAYSASKGALDAFTLSLAKGLGPRGITVNSVSPGIILTRNHTRLIENPDAAAQQASRVALGRLGLPEDVADIVAFLASDDSRWVTAQVIDATGGTEI